MQWAGRGQGLRRITPQKEAAETFLRMAAAGQARQAFDRFVGAGFRHHNPSFRADPAILIAGMEENARAYPGKTFEILQSIGDGDHVAVHSRIQMDRDQQPFAVVHLFRFDGEQIVEMWDVAQQEPVDSPNDNGMF